jgi:hypothetical protein
MEPSNFSGNVPKTLTIVDNRSPEQIQKESAIWAHKRKPQTEIDQKLSSVAEQWLSTLPVEVLPEFLVVRFPRIVNKIAANWNLKFNVNKYLDELTIKQREDRQGFPDDVFRELLKISIYSRSRDK